MGIGDWGLTLHVNLLTHEPEVVVLLVTTDEWEFTWQGIDSLEILQVLAAVERLHVEAFVGSPNQFLLEVRTLEVHLNLVQPLLCGGRLKLREEFFFHVSHKISIKKCCKCFHINTPQHAHIGVCVKKSTKVHIFYVCHKGKWFFLPFSLEKPKNGGELAGMLFVYLIMPKSRYSLPP